MNRKLLVNSYFYEQKEKLYGSWWWRRYELIDKLWSIWPRLRRLFFSWDVFIVDDGFTSNDVLCALWYHTIFYDHKLKFSLCQIYKYNFFLNLIGKIMSWRPDWYLILLYIIYLSENIFHDIEILIWFFLQIFFILFIYFMMILKFKYACLCGETSII